MMDPRRDPEAIGELMQGESPSEDASELARALAARRRRTTATCEVCGAAFETWARKTQQARTCTPKCRQRLWRREKKRVSGLCEAGNGR